MPGYRKLGRTTSSGRKAMLRNLTTNLLYHGKITTTEARAKEVRSIAEKLITIAVKEHTNYEVLTVTTKVAKKDATGKRVREKIDGKSVTVFEEKEQTIKKDEPSRLAARRKILSYLYPVTEAPDNDRYKRKKRKGVTRFKDNNRLKRKVDMAAKMFDEIAPNYSTRTGGYTRIVRIGARKGDAAEMVLLELV